MASLDDDLANQIHNSSDPPPEAKEAIETMLQQTLQIRVDMIHGKGTYEVMRTQVKEGLLFTMMGRN